MNASSQGGAVTVSRAAAADIDSGGAPVIASGIKGSLIVAAEGGGIRVRIAGGPSSASTALAGIVSVTTDGGGLQITPPGAGA